MDVEEKVLEKLIIARNDRPCTLKIRIEADDKIANIILKPDGQETRILYLKLS